MRLRIAILILTLSFCSCQNQQPAKTGQQTRSDTASHSPSIAAIKSDETYPTTEDFYNFWNRFRTAVIHYDTNQLVTMTQFPFKTRGPLDSDPTVKYSKEKFISVFSAFLNQWNGQDLDGTTELGSIKKTEAPDKTYVQKEDARVGNLVFNKADKGWKLVFAYLNQETIDSLKK